MQRIQIPIPFLTLLKRCLTSACTRKHVVSQTLSLSGEAQSVRRQDTHRIRQNRIMIKTYKILDETATHTTYQLNSVSIYWLYLSGMLTIIGYTSKVLLIFLFGAFLLVSYLVIIYFPALAVIKKVRAARQNNTARITGSQWSFSRPLTVKIPKTTESKWKK